MTKTDLIKRIADRTGQPITQVEKAVGAMLDNIRAALLAGDKVTFADFGTFAVAERKARQGRNPQTGESLTIAARKIVKFAAGKGLKESLNPGA